MKKLVKLNLNSGKGELSFILDKLKSKKIIYINDNIGIKNYIIFLEDLIKLLDKINKEEKVFIYLGATADYYSNPKIFKLLETLVVSLNTEVVCLILDLNFDQGDFQNSLDRLFDNIEVLNTVDRIEEERRKIINELISNKYIIKSNISERELKNTSLDQLHKYLFEIEDLLLPIESRNKKMIQGILNKDSLGKDARIKVYKNYVYDLEGFILNL